MSGRAVPVTAGTGLRRTGRRKKRQSVAARLTVLAGAGLLICLLLALSVGGNNTEVRPQESAEPILIAGTVGSPEPLAVEQEQKIPARPYTDEDVKLIAKAVYGEALVTRSDTEMAAVAWCILNRVDSDDPFFPDTIAEVVTQYRQFHGYHEDNPVDEHIAWLVQDVLEWWTTEKNGETTVGRVLPAEYLYFYGDGKHNHFTVEWLEGEPWDWSLPSPYEN